MLLKWVNYRSILFCSYGIVQPQGLQEVHMCSSGTARSVCVVCLVLNLCSPYMDFKCVADTCGSIFMWARC